MECGSEVPAFPDKAATLLPQSNTEVERGDLELRTRGAAACYFPPLSRAMFSLIAFKSFG
jgi:hypothetical protein